MNKKQYLVVLRTNLDELPLALCTSMKRANMIAMGVTDEQADKMAALMKVDAAGRINVAVITFAGERPVRMDIVRDRPPEAPRKMMA